MSSAAAGWASSTSPATFATAALKLLLPESPPDPAPRRQRRVLLGLALAYLGRKADAVCEVSEASS